MGYAVIGAYNNSRENRKGIFEMTIREAVEEAKKCGEWSVVDGEPTSVDIEFWTDEGRDDETQLDIWGFTDEEKIAELEDLWASLCYEFESDKNNINSVYAYGYIRD